MDALDDRTQATDPFLHNRLGAYRLTRLLGAGGMGAVYLGERDDGTVDRKVAIKVVRPGLADLDTLRRFHQEQRVLARLDHPNIVKLLDAGFGPGGAPYVVMDFVPGRPLDVWCRETNANIVQRLRLFLGVCAAVQSAHQHLIVHRDLKPANILVTDEGIPKLLDFGIAKPMDQNEGLTQAGLGLFTPNYASPEQLRGEPAGISTDVYALGVILFRLLAEQLPFQRSAESMAQWMHDLLNNEPPAPSSVAPQDRRKAIRGDLDAIVAKALRRDPAERYQSAADLAADIERHLAGSAVEARRGNRRYVAARFVRRHALGLGAAAAVLICLLGGILATMIEARRANQAYERADRLFDESRQLIQTLLGEVFDAAGRLQGSAELRTLIATRAHLYLEQLARDAGDELDVQCELAGNYLRLGSIEVSLGRQDRALAALAKARRFAHESGTTTVEASARLLRGELLAGMARKAEARQELEGLGKAWSDAVEAARWQDAWAGLTGDISDWERAAAAWDDAAVAPGASAETKRRAAEVHWVVSKRLWDAGQSEAAKAHLRAALQYSDR